MEDSEQELRQAFDRLPAPASLKRKIMARRRGAAQRHSFPLFAWRGLAASIVSVSLCILAALVLYGDYQWREAEQRRKGEEARQQVLTALRITGRALNHMNQQLAAHHHASRE
jgi:nicotinamide riboside transporter PnuC